MKPILVPEDFKPSQRIYALAHEREIPNEFVDGCVGEFIFWFQEKGCRRKSWQKSFWNWVKNGWSYKKEAEKKTVRTNPSANQEWIGEKIEVSKSKMTLKQRLRNPLQNGS